MTLSGPVDQQVSIGLFPAGQWPRQAQTCKAAVSGLRPKLLLDVAFLSFPVDVAFDLENIIWNPRKLEINLTS